MGKRLGRVEYDHGVTAASDFARHFGDRVNDARDVRDVRQGNRFRAQHQQAAEVIEVDAAAVVDPGQVERRGAPPGQDLGMVGIETADDLILGAQSKALGDHVEGFGCVLHEYDLARARTEVIGDRHAHRFVGVRRLLRQAMLAAMDVRAVRCIVLRDRLDHGCRLQRRRGAVEVDRCAAVEIARQRGKVLAERVLARAHR